MHRSFPDRKTAERIFVAFFCLIFSAVSHANADSNLYKVKAVLPA